MLFLAHPIGRYDGDRFLEEVDADFVVWEIHGRHDFKHTATAKKVCSRSMQRQRVMWTFSCRPSVCKPLRHGEKCLKTEQIHQKHGQQRYILTQSQSALDHMRLMIFPLFSPKTYRSCYERAGELNRRTEYQILNSSGVTSLKWPERNGMYVFSATVVARDYRLAKNNLPIFVRKFNLSVTVSAT